MTLAPIAPTWAIAALLLAGIALLLVACVPRRRPAWIVRGLLLVAIAAAGANPVVGRVGAEAGTADVTIMFVVDTTASSAAEDLPGGRTRLSGMQEDMRAIVARFRGARFSMVTFDRTARVVLPTTDDTEATTVAIDSLLPELGVYSAGSRIDEPVDALDDLLDGERGSGTVLVYLGDGEDMGGRSDAGRFGGLEDDIRGGAVLGYGTQRGGEMRETSTSTLEPGDYLRDAAGEPVRSRADERALREVARTLDVPYSHRDGADEEAPRVEVEGRSGRLLGGVRTTADVDRGIYWLFGLVAAALLLVELAGLVRPVTEAGHLPGGRS